MFLAQVLNENKTLSELTSLLLMSLDNIEETQTRQ